MGFLKSFLKSCKIKSMQLKIWPPNSGEATEQNLKRAYDFDEKEIAKRSSARAKRGKAENDYFDYIIQLEGVQNALATRNMGRSHLVEIVNQLNKAGGLMRVKGHLISYSSIAYVAPLRYCIEMIAQGLSADEFIGPLVYYWEGKISDLELLRLAGFDV